MPAKQPKKKTPAKAPAKKTVAVKAVKSAKPVAKKGAHGATANQRGMGLVVPGVSERFSKEIYLYANGKRKTAIASVRLHKNGQGKITVNKRTFENYFPLFIDQDKILSPLKMTNTVKTFDISVYVYGGGIHAQAEAVRHGISKALLLFDQGLRGGLKQAGFLTRDPRIKERKKYGLHRARRGPQFSKR